MGEIKLVLSPLIFRIYSIPIILLLITVFILIGITIYFVKKEISNDN